MVDQKFYMNSRFKHLFCAVILAVFAATPSWAFQDEKGESDATSVAPKNQHQGPISCQDGFAGAFSCQNVHLVSFLSLSELGAPTGIGLNDAWGWKDPDTNKKYALIGREDGVAFVDVSNPETPIYVGELLRTKNTPPTVWRDIKVDGYFAFVVADGTGSNARHGMQVFDLRKLRSFSGAPITFDTDALYDNFSMAHNIAIDEETHRAFIVGARGAGEACNGGLHMVDISAPVQSTFLGCFADPSTGRSGSGYIHDTQCVVYRGPDTTKTGREICFSSNETAISIVDVTNPNTPNNLSTGRYPNAAYVHQGWLTEDQRYFVQNDELDESAFGRNTRTMIWDVSVLREPELLTVFESDVQSIDHNLYIRNGLAYQANYSSGLRILDVRTPENPAILGWFDTTPEINTVSFNGAWTAYPYLDEDIVIVTSRKEGVFIVKPASIVGTRFESTHFSADQGNATFQWTMGTEHHVTRYDIEKRLEDGSYEAITSVEALEGVGTNRSYQTTLSIDEGVYHFRISARSTDGGVVSSEDQVVVFLEGKYLLDAPYPNPVSTTAYSSIAVEASQRVIIDLFDLGGRRVQQVFHDLVEQGTQVSFTFDVTNLSGGVYVLRVEGETFTTSSEVVVVR